VCHILDAHELKQHRVRYGVEQRFVAVPRTVATARFKGGRLEVRTANGALAATLTQAAAPQRDAARTASLLIA